MDQPRRYLPFRQRQFAVINSNLRETRREAFEALPPRLRPGDALGHFRIEREIANGATATVYEAFQPSDRERVALKVLSPHLALAPRAVSRFQAEADFASRVKDPCIIRIHESGKSRNHYFFVMDLHSGETAGELSWKFYEEQGEACFQRAAMQFAGVGRALARLHLQGMVHRDVKPQNLLLSREGQLILSDFGSALDSRDRVSLLEHSLWGTVGYMSPEQFGPEADPYDPLMDIYALGLSLYEVVTGISAFPVSSQEELVRLKLTRVPRPPRRVNPRVPLGLDAVIRQAIEPNPRLRYPDMGSLAEDIERFAEMKRGHRR